MKKLFFVFFFLAGVLSAQTLENVKYNTTNGKVGTTNGGTTTNGKPLDLPANTTLGGGPIGGGGGDAVTTKNLDQFADVTQTIGAILNITGATTLPQTTVSGNAGSATKLATARAINGVPFDGTAAITVPAAGSTLTDPVLPVNGALPAFGAVGQVLVKSGTANYAAGWQNAAGGTGSGDVSAAAPFGTDNRLVRSDGVAKGVQGSAVTLDDAGNLSGIATATSSDLSTSTFTILDDINHNFGLEIHEGTAFTSNHKLIFIGNTADVTFNFTASTNLTFPPAGTLLSNTPATAVAGTYGDASHVPVFTLLSDGRISGTPALATITGGSATTPGGLNKQVQYNDNGAFNGDTGMTLDKATHTITVTKIAGGGTVPTGGTTNQVLSKVDGTNYNVQWSTPATGGSGSPGGSSTQVQFNDAGAFAGSANLTFDKATGTLHAGTLTGNGAVPSTGLTGQFLQKSTDNPYDLVWATPIPAATPKVSKVIWLTTTGSGTFTVDSGCRALYVEAMGGGGGSAGALGTATPSGAVAGGGGGGGCAGKYYAPVAASYSYTVGAGGLAGAATPTAGGDGGNTTFDTSSPLTGFGGKGSAIPAARTTIGISGGVGIPLGNLAASNGDTYLTGSPGTMGITTTGPNGWGGFGGNSVWGGGVASAANVNFVGIVGNLYGGGAAGAASANATGQAGAAGGQGAIKVTEFF